MVRSDGVRGKPPGGAGPARGTPSVRGLARGTGGSARPSAAGGPGCWTGRLRRRHRPPRGAAASRWRRLEGHRDAPGAAVDPLHRDGPVRDARLVDAEPRGGVEALGADVAVTVILWPRPGRRVGGRRSGTRPRPPRRVWVGAKRAVRRRHHRAVGPARDERAGVVAAVPGEASASRLRSAAPAQDRPDDGAGRVADRPVDGRRRAEPEGEVDACSASASPSCGKNTGRGRRDEPERAERVHGPGLRRRCGCPARSTARIAIV